MRIFNLLLAGLLLAPISFMGLSQEAAEAHSGCPAHKLSGEDAVDSGEIRWGGSTKYSWEWDDARAAWNNLGAIDILPDNINTYQDLTVSDIDNAYLSWWGAYDYDYVGSDEIEFNEHHMDGGSYGNRAHIVSHELGHALGLAHRVGSQHVMDNDQYYTTVTPSSADECDYNHLWN
jgi:hypothetical protein